MTKLAQLAIEPQPAPQYGNGEIVANDLIDWTIEEQDPEIAEAIGARKRLGAERYGQALQTNDGRNNLADLVQELLDALKKYLAQNDIEGIVWHHPDGRMVKIKGKDFGIKRGAKQ